MTSRLHFAIASSTNARAHTTGWFRRRAAANKTLPKAVWSPALQKKQEGITLIIHNEDIKELTAEISEGHRHLRTTVVLQNGTELIFQEAAIANLVRAYITVKTHPSRKKIVLKGKKIEERKDGYAEWQLIEE